MYNKIQQQYNEAVYVVAGLFSYTAITRTPEQNTKVRGVTFCSVINSGSAKRNRRRRPLSSFNCFVAVLLYFIILMRAPRFV